ncbi:MULTISPECIES: murein biosynthesis integral membrane protein MurJ [unclassified Synechocystis]|uniref:murein biosynthesis integral membrane protein MurJ n=1 Tax=unclassified Synechocystis TaxID=2640012 RepID=UPI000414A0BB|nr:MULTISPECIES: murein biosynthesis integral membrane protein MurJ [unclassified Synechocystis]AIE73481.1 putative peptidoglycan lipid II flippase MurJ [Synechocystis sp. PCC 6714]MCT0254166.1 murein biosynthesis integral membrane protein MurJ [Synechocystis sp. CS-94]
MSSSGKSSRSLANIAGIVAIATLVSKVFGLFREQIIAAAFGVGTVVNAYAYAYVIPGFLFILLGGINGPFHSALVSVLSKRDREEAAPLVETVTTLVSGVLLAVTIILVLGAGLFIDLLAPGLEPETRRIAVQQLQIMAPMALLSGLIGIGFGTLNAADQYLLPSISPLLSSITVILGLGVAVWQLGDQLNTPPYWLLGSLLLAGGTTAGAVLQWAAQIVPQAKAGMGKLRLRFNFALPGVKEVLQVMIPATLSSGMLYINFATNLFFASFIPNAAAAMRYGNFVALTPLGIISNMILVPFLPVFSRLADPQNWPELKIRIRQGIMLSALTMFPLTAILVGLAIPIVQVIYERGAFDAEAAAEVSPVLAAYGLGMFFYLGRDVLVRVFYALGDGQSPFRVSLFNIFLNGLLDFLFYKPFGTVGIVMATVGVNLFSMAIFIWMLNRRLSGLSLLSWAIDLGKLAGITAIASVAGWQGSILWQKIWGVNSLVENILEVLTMSSIILVVFAVGTAFAKVPEVELLGDRLLKKFKRF